MLAVRNERPIVSSEGRPRLLAWFRGNGCGRAIEHAHRGLVTGGFVPLAEFGK